MQCFYCKGRMWKKRTEEWWFVKDAECVACVESVEDSLWRWHLPFARMGLINFERGEKVKRGNRQVRWECSFPEFV